MNNIYINDNIYNIKKIINSDIFINKFYNNNNPIILNNDAKIINLNILIKNLKYFPEEIISLLNISDFKLEIIQKTTNNRISLSINKININNDFLNDILKNFNYKFIIFINENKENKNNSILTLKNKYIGIENNTIFGDIINNYMQNILFNILINRLEKYINILLNANI